MTNDDKGSVEDEEASISRSSRRSKSESQISRLKSEHSEHEAKEQIRDAPSALKALGNVLSGAKKSSSKNVIGTGTPTKKFSSS